MISLRAPLAITVVRVATAAVLVVHGIARATLVSSMISVGWAVRPLALWFALQLLAGIVLIHGRVGWFVVGAGRNGMEFSVLLIVCLLAVALASREGYRLGSRALNS